ncbi:Swp1p [Sugiyamaella lignohabitans]|uniref:Swp1p n=1 Tax=Sugiyamaella lignohabitans TaxID=796027 RepID=A0A167CU42_9ASCO|nr:Swp1p [Sugiyamaella lignohabitans]ANB12109.1 Swp1p [Sugiyamaella lignohabitans]
MFTGSVRPNGKADISIAHKSVPLALQGKKLKLTVLVGSFGSDKPVAVEVTDSFIVAQTQQLTEPARLKALPELHHTFRAPPKTVAKPIALAFVGIVTSLLVILLGFWLGTADLAALGSAVSKAPLGHIGLLSSLLAFELVFVRYFQGTSIFDTLFAVAFIAPVAIFTGSRALREVRERRLNGQFN